MHSLLATCRLTVNSYSSQSAVNSSASFSTSSISLRLSDHLPNHSNGQGCTEAMGSRTDAPSPFQNPGSATDYPQLGSPSASPHSPNHKETSCPPRYVLVMSVHPIIFLLTRLNGASEQYILWLQLQSPNRIIIVNMLTSLTELSLLTAAIIQAKKQKKNSHVYRGESGNTCGFT